MNSSVITQPEYWPALQLHGARGGPRFMWRNNAGKDYDLLKPLLHTRPGPVVCRVHCPEPECPRLRRITNPYDEVFIMEQGDDCYHCEPDRSYTRDDLLPTWLNGKVFAAALAKALEFNPAPLPELLIPKFWVDLGTVIRNGLTMPVTLIYARQSGIVNLDAAFPGSTPRVILHIDMDDDFIASLQQRRFITVHLPSVVQPARNGTFKAKQPLAAILAGVPVPEVADKSTLNEINQNLDGLPHRVAALLGNSRIRKRQYSGLITEPTFTAQGGFRLICYQGVTYRLGPKAGAVLLSIYHGMKELSMSKVPQDLITDEIYGDKEKNSKKNIPRVSQLFRTGDASRLWKAGFIGHDNHGNFFLTPLMHA